MIVTRDNYQHLHAAFLEIELDNGGHHVNRIATAQGLEAPIDLESFFVPEAWSHLVSGAEHGLSKLSADSADDLETFLCGDQDEADTIRKRRGDLDEAHILINSWFNGWQPEDAPFSQPLSVTSTERQA